MRSQREVPAAGKAVSVLLVEDDERDYQFTRRLLDAAEDVRFDLDWVRTVEGGLCRLRERTFDVCLVDSPLPGGGDALDLVRAARGRSSGPPIILLSDGTDRALDLAAMTIGAADYLDKSRVDAVLLERSIRYALARRQSADRLAYLAQFDDLTGLANRALFQDRLERALAMARRSGRLVAVFVLDLNGFKAVNDGLGHVAGDRLLVQVAARLRGVLRETDTVARLGGDEFAVVIENLRQPEHAALVARKLLDGVAPPLRLDDRTVTVTASVGVALYPEDARDATGLRRRADAAMYRAKARGGNLCRFHNESLEHHAQQRGSLTEGDLRRALARHEFELHFHPQIALNPEQSLGLAARLRWRHPEFGLLAAARFLPLAEDLGLVEALADWMLGEACHRLQRWHGDGFRRLHIAVPLLSGRQLAWSDLATKIGLHGAEHRLDPGCLEVELPEAMLLADAEADGGAGAALLRGAGVRLALDAYGSGTTSLRSLECAGLDTLKLARDLLRGVPDDPRRTVVVGAAIAAAKDLGLRVVAEGVDGRSPLGFLRGRGCDAVQGVMGCPPLPAAACAAWLHRVGTRD